MTAKAKDWLDLMKHTFAAGVFPAQMSFLLELKARNFLLSPEKLVERLSPQPNSRVLEVGAGSGFYSVAAARAVPRGHLELLDLQAEMLAQAKLKIERADLHNVGYTAASANNELPFENESFDRIFMVLVLGEIVEKTVFLSEARRVLRADGTLSISEHLPDPDFIRFKKLRGLLESCDFKFARRYGWSLAYTANFEKV